jgi:hypothetical protein
VDARKVDQIGCWLGKHTPAREALAQLLLIRLADDLLNYASLTRIESVDQCGEKGAYADYSTWYWAQPGAPFAIARVSDAGRQPFAGVPFKECLAGLADIVRRELASSPEEAEQLISSTTRQTQPPCMHRFTRYLDVQITSIGALRWRGNLPPETAPRAAWQDFTDQARAALGAWADGAPAASKETRRIYAALGTPTELKRAIVRDFAMGGFWDVGDSAAWDWLVLGAQTTGTNACAVFCLQDTFGQTGETG